MSENTEQSSTSFSGQQDEQFHTQDEEGRSSSMGGVLFPRDRESFRTQRIRNASEHVSTLGISTAPRLGDQVFSFSAPRNEEGRSSTREELSLRNRSVHDTQQAENYLHIARTTIHGQGDRQTPSFSVPQIEETQSSIRERMSPQVAAQILIQRARNDYILGMGTSFLQGDNQTFSFSALRDSEDRLQNEDTQGHPMIQENFQRNWSDYHTGRTRGHYQNSSADPDSREDTVPELNIRRDEAGFEDHHTPTSRPMEFTYGNSPITASHYAYNSTPTQILRQTEEHAQNTEVFNALRPSSNVVSENIRRNGEQNTHTGEVQNSLMPIEYVRRARGEPRRRVRFDRDNHLTSASRLSSNVTRPSAEAFQQMMHPVIGDSQAEFSLSTLNRPRRTFASRNEDIRTAELNRMLIYREENRLLLAEFRARNEFLALGLSERRNKHRNDFRLEVIKRVLTPASAEQSDCCPICQEGYIAAIENPARPIEVQSCPHCQKQYTTTPNNNDAHDACSMPMCTHVFGRGCITRWLKDNNTCPMCRARIALP
ncbi:hypothetical protein DID88_006652 [Monilinia fructigena]|uniref:RING-type domain-containing protein n=1 Tax=Monilinia fructigena TaxID=38457 RepID=A0A395IFP6_9HELO|nr:hypothetical protein DID88_006652 [Monilinia fructigena]